MTINATENTAVQTDLDADFEGIEMNADQRVHDRHDISTDGQIKFGNGFKVQIKVVDMSRSGARLRLMQYFVLPNEFDVEIFSPDRRKLKIATCSRQWQRQGECGVKFLTSRTELTPEGCY